MELQPALQRALRRSRLLVVVAETNVLRSVYVPKEIEQFLQKRKGRVLPINVGSFLESGKTQPAPFDYLQGITWLSESEQAFQLGSPTEEVVNGIQKSFRRLRVASISRVITWATIVFLFSAATVALVQRQAAVRQAEIALAQAYASDLNLAERAHESRDTPAVLELLARYESRLGASGLPEFAWLHLWGLYHQERHQMLHEAAVSSLALSPDGTTMATTVRLSEETGGGVVRLWDTSTGRERFKMTLPKNTTAGVASFSPAGDILATAVYDFITQQQQIILWTVSTGQQLKTVLSSGAVYGLEFTPDGRSLVALSTEGVDAPFQIWDLQTDTKRYSNDDPIQVVKPRLLPSPLRRTAQVLRSHTTKRSIVGRSTLPK